MLLQGHPCPYAGEATDRLQRGVSGERESDLRRTLEEQPLQISQPGELAKHGNYWQVEIFENYHKTLAVDFDPSNISETGGEILTNSLVECASNCLQLKDCHLFNAKR